MAKIITGTQLPTRATVFADEFNALSGSLAAQVNTLQGYNFEAFNPSPAIGDRRACSVFLRAGTYSLSIFLLKGIDRGIFDVYVDNIPVAIGFDLYASVATYNIVLTTTVTFTTDGYHTITLQVTGKNGSSLSYYLGMTKIWFKQASDIAPSAGTNKSFVMTDLPNRAVVWHDEATVLTGNAIAITIDTGQIDNYYARQSTSADADSFTQSVFLRAGTYTFSAEGQTNAANGKIDWYLDSVSFTTAQDWYSAAQTKNVVKTASVTIASDGYHVLKGVINGKNASSSGFNIDLTVYWFRTAAD